MSLTLLHITDPHLVAPASGRLHGWAVQSTFDAVLSRARGAHPEADALLLGGDLVDDLSVAGYQRLDACLAPLGLPVLAVAGNHDHPARMQTHLPHCVVHDALSIGAWQVLGLDTHLPGAEHGALDTTTLQTLANRLAADTRPALIMLHHPPLAIGTPWIDAIGLRAGQAEFAELVRTGPQIRGVLAGHVHQAAEHTLHGRPVWTTPSTMRQFMPGARAFAEDNAVSPGYRCVRLYDDGSIESWVERLPRPDS